MILTIDVGNMNIKSALFEGETMVKYGRFSTNITYTSDEYGILFTNLFAQKGIKLTDVDGIAISSVVPTMNFTLEHMCRNYFNMLPMMIEPGIKVYEGMIIGEHARENDLEVNALKGKQLTNIRTTSKDEAVRLTPPKKLTLEQSLGYIADDEYVEVTPKSIRLRKIWLDPNDRKRMMRASKAS